MCAKHGLDLSDVVAYSNQEHYESIIKFVLPHLDDHVESFKVEAISGV